MKDYTVYFEVFGKKMKTTVLAANKNSAEMVVKNKIVINTKIVKIYNEAESDFNKLFDSFK